MKTTTSEHLVELVHQSIKDRRKEMTFGVNVVVRQVMEGEVFADGVGWEAVREAGRNRV